MRMALKLCRLRNCMYQDTDSGDKRPGSCVLGISSILLEANPNQLIPLSEKGRPSAVRPLAFASKVSHGSVGISAAVPLQKGKKAGQSDSLSESTATMQQPLPAGHASLPMQPSPQQWRSPAQSRSASQKELPQFGHHCSGERRSHAVQSARSGAARGSPGPVGSTPLRAWSSPALLRWRRWVVRVLVEAAQAAPVSWPPTQAAASLPPTQAAAVATAVATAVTAARH
eukprot:942324-Prymnesium_polylepis.1